MGPRFREGFAEFTDTAVGGRRLVIGLWGNRHWGQREAVVAQIRLDLRGSSIV